MKRLLFGLLFFVLLIFLLFKASPINTVGGDEVVVYTSLLPFIHGIKEGIFFPSFLTFFHEPMFQIIQFPFVFFGANIFIARLPNLIASVLIFFVLYKIGQVLFNKKHFYIVCLLCLYIASGFFQVFRSELNHSLFNLILLTGTLFLLRFDKDGKLDNLYKAYIFFLLSFFTYIDGIFCILGFGIYWFFTRKRKTTFFDKRLILYSLVAGSTFIIWASLVYLGSSVSGLYSWQGQAPFSLLARGTSYSIYGIVENIDLFIRHNNPVYLAFILFFSVASLFSLKSRPIWVLIFIPLIYFNLVKMPTVHLLNFFTLILVLTVIGLELFLNRFKLLTAPVLAVFVVALVFNIAPISFFNPFIVDADYKLAATKLRSITNVCDTIYTDLDGFTFRVYFNRPYETKLTPNTKYAVLKKENSSLDFKKVAMTDNFVIYSKTNLKNVEIPKDLDNNMFGFNETMTYVLKCRK